MARLTIAMAQLNPIVGDVAGNLEKLLKARTTAQALGADILVTPELYVSGYPPEDLVMNSHFQARIHNGVQLLAKQIDAKGPAILLGTPWVDDGHLYNSAVLLHDGRVVAVRHKHDLPNYGVFDEKRLFTAGPLSSPILFNQVRLGVMICEDMWTAPVAKHLAQHAADILVVLNGSPYEQGKHPVRLELAAKRTEETGLPLVYVNQVGGQDDLVFDGASFALNRDGALYVQAPYFTAHMTVVEANILKNQAGTTDVELLEGDVTPRGSKWSDIYQAIQLGLRDYVEKNGFERVVLGLSGGIDSALVATMAVDALGPQRVSLFMLPSPYTSQQSLDDAATLAKRLHCQLQTINIDQGVQWVQQQLSTLSASEAAADLTAQNIQSRMRAVLLMAVSNLTGAMLLTTGNKSELATGYTTLYGDLCGSYAPLKDVYKSEVYALAAWRNQNHPSYSLCGLKQGEIIPSSIIKRAPTAELKPHQTDQDTLPPYEQLDLILRALVDGEHTYHDLQSKGMSSATIQRVQTMLTRSEFKRRQSPPGPKVSRMAFGRDRRYPITNKLS